MAGSDCADAPAVWVFAVHISIRHIFTWLDSAGFGTSGYLSETLMTTNVNLLK